MPDSEVSTGPTWWQLLRYWRLVEADLQDVYGIDVDDDDLLDRRTWRWLQVRVWGLLERPPSWVTYGDGRLAAVHTTRIGHALYPPKFD